MHFPRRRLALPAGLVLLAATLYRYSPAQSGFYPTCPIHHLTGLLCPGCGATRALAALLHGRLADAIHLNALFVLLVLPSALCYLVLSRGRWVRVPGQAAWAFTLVTVAFTIARNLP